MESGLVLYVFLDSVDVVADDFVNVACFEYEEYFFDCRIIADACQGIEDYRAGFLVLDILKCFTEVRDGDFVLEQAQYVCGSGNDFGVGRFGVLDELVQDILVFQPLWSWRDLFCLLRCLQDFLIQVLHTK